MKIPSTLFLFFLFSFLLPAQHQCFTPNLIAAPTSQDFLKQNNVRFEKPIVQRDLSSLERDTYYYQRFFVRNIFNQSRWDTIVAQRIFDHQIVSLWLDTASSTLLTPQEVDSIVLFISQSLLYKTSAHSIDSTLGILSLLHTYFGLPPNVDDDGRIDILLLDIKDSFLSTGSFIAGFFDPNDLTNNTYSNKRDLLYIDVNPLIKNNGIFSPYSAASTIAHEYQHLIHAHYERGEAEYVFINEGLSEYAEIACGFIPRSPNEYLRNPQRPLFSWNYFEPIPDYARASLWTHYLFEHVGIQFIKTLVQTPEIGMEGIHTMLNHATGKTFEQIFSNWTLANFFNDTRISKELGYQHPLRQAFRIQPSTIIDALPSFYPFTIFNSSCTIIQVPLSNLIHLKSKYLLQDIEMGALVTYPNGVVQPIKNISGNIISISADQHPHGNVEILLRNVSAPIAEDDRSSRSIEILFSGKKNGAVVEQQYDDGTTDTFSKNASYLLIDSSRSVGVLFYHAQPAWLKGISIKAIFRSEIQGSGVSIFTPRDIEYQIFTVKNGIPDSALTGRRIWSFRRAIGVLSYENIPLSEDYVSLANLKDTFCVVISNDPDDVNEFGVGMDNMSSTFSILHERDSSTNTMNWISFKDKRIDTASLAGWNAMVRTESIVSINKHFEKNMFTSNISVDSIVISFLSYLQIDILKSRGVASYPDGNYVLGNINGSKISIPYKGAGSYVFYLSLYSNDKMYVDTMLVINVIPQNPIEAGNSFPNPFNSSINIPITLWSEGNVIVEIYDVLGRKIFEKSCGYFSTGRHTVPVFFERIASSTYFIHIIHRDNNGTKTSKYKRVIRIK